MLRLCVRSLAAPSLRCSLPVRLTLRAVGASRFHTTSTCALHYFVATASAVLLGPRCSLPLASSPVVATNARCAGTRSFSSDVDAAASDSPPSAVILEESSVASADAASADYTSAKTRLHELHTQRHQLTRAYLDGSMQVDGSDRCLADTATLRRNFEQIIALLQAQPQLSSTWINVDHMFRSIRRFSLDDLVWPMYEQVQKQLQRSKPLNKTLYIIMSELMRTGGIDRAEAQLLWMTQQKHVQPTLTPPVFLLILNAMAKLSDLPRMRSFFDSIPDKSQAIFDTMIAAYEAANDQPAAAALRNDKKLLRRSTSVAVPDSTANLASRSRNSAEVRPSSRSVAAKEVPTIKPRLAARSPVTSVASHPAAASPVDAPSSIIQAQLVALQAELSRATPPQHSSILQRADSIWQLAREQPNLLMSAQVTLAMQMMFAAPVPLDIPRQIVILEEACQAETAAWSEVQPSATSEASTADAALRPQFVDRSSFALLFTSFCASPAPAVWIAEAGQWNKFADVQFGRAGPHASEAVLQVAYVEYLLRAQFHSAALHRWKLLPLAVKTSQASLLPLLLHSCAGMHNPLAAKDVLTDVESLQLPLDSAVSTPWLQCFVRSGDVSSSDRIWQRIIKAGVQPNSADFRARLQTFITASARDSTILQRIDEVLLEMRRGHSSNAQPAASIRFDADDLSSLIVCSQQMQQQALVQRWMLMADYAGLTDQLDAAAKRIVNELGEGRRS